MSLPSALKIATIATQLGIKVQDYADVDMLFDACINKLNTTQYIPYPVALHTVDIVPYRFFEGGVQVLLGRKPYRTIFQFIGGFVDPRDSSELAAMRELHEEAGLELPIGIANYLGSYFINDSRYVDQCHKVTTSFFKVEVEDGMEPVAGDDIEEVRWFNLRELTPTEVLPQHHELLKVLQINFGGVKTF